ncbi:MAG: hypothetical protein Q4C70_09940 [Planctomycetia bacterium]|nr:hypothetical protein [Planctomycetia bacterium]
MGKTKHAQFYFRGNIDTLIDKIFKRISLAGYELDIERQYGDMVIIVAEKGSVISKCFGFASKYIVRISKEGDVLSLVFEDDWGSPNIVALFLGILVVITWFTAIIGFLTKEKPFRNFISLVSTSVRMYKEEPVINMHINSMNSFR